MSAWTPKALEASRELAAELGQSSWLDEPATVPDDADFIIRSRTRLGVVYPMVRTPEGIAVHQGLGCEGEQFNGVTGCWHSKEFTRSDHMTETALTVGSSTSLTERIEFNPEQIKTLKNTICRGASDAELQLFVYACQDLNLNPFLKQIWAIMRRVKNAAGSYDDVLTIQVGIDGYRVMRDRIRDANNVPLFEGMDGPQWSDDGKGWYDYPPVNGKPEYARVGVWRRGVPRPFVAVTRMGAYYQENAMWNTMAAEQLAKCAEALAYRRAFPAEMSALPSGPVIDYDEAQLAAPLPVGAIEGEVIEHGDTQGQAQPARHDTPEAPASPPATGAAEAGYDETVAEIRKVYADLVQSSGDPVWLAAIHDAVTKIAPLCVSRGTFYAERIKRTDVARVLEVLRVKQRGSSPEAPPAVTGCEHEPRFTADNTCVCSKCGEILDQNTGLPLGPQKVTIAAD